MKIYKEFCEFQPWSGAIDTWDKIYNSDKIDEFENLLDELYPEGIDETQLNDILWFDSDWVLETLGIIEEEEEE